MHSRYSRQVCSKFNPNFNSNIFKFLLSIERFATLEDAAWFEKTIRRVAEEEFGERLAENCYSTRYFVDFMR